MNESFEGSTYVIRTLKYIIEIQKKLKGKRWNFQEDRLSNGLAFDGNRLFPMQKPINTIPIILFSNGKPLNQVGVLTSTDGETTKEIYKTFSTYLFRLQFLSGKWAILELLKFKNDQHCSLSGKGHFCSLSCQLDSEEIENLVSTGVNVTVDLSDISSLLCLPAVRL